MIAPARSAAVLCLRAMGADLLQFVRAVAALLLLSNVAAAETSILDLFPTTPPSDLRGSGRSATPTSLFFYFGFLVAVFLGVWIWLNAGRFWLGFSICCIAFALLVFVGMTEYSVR